MALGLTTAVFAYLAGSVQTDIKSALSFASLSQVGIIVAEIGGRFPLRPLIHILGHACLRTLQFVRAPTLLQDYRALENAIGERLPRTSGTPLGRMATGRFQAWVYRLALERGYLDAMLLGMGRRPVRAGSSGGATRWSGGGPTSSPAAASRESDEVNPTSGRSRSCHEPPLNSPGWNWRSPPRWSARRS